MISYSRKHNKPVLIGLCVLVVLFFSISIWYGRNVFDDQVEQEIIENLENNNPYEISNINDSSIEKVINIEINESEISLQDETINRWVYTDESGEIYDAGKPIITNIGDKLTLNVKNNTSEQTNVHWHGLHVSSDQDGPDIIINPNSSHQYSFVTDTAGTYWYHSHENPVRDQVDNGMYAPFIVKEPSDLLYSSDYILMLDDWNTKNDWGMSMMNNEKIGNIDTVNGKTGNEIFPIELKTNEIAKLRFIGSSTALTHTISFPFEVMVTHMDGYALSNAYMTDEIVVSPGERFDVQLQYSGDESKVFYINNQRDNGLAIPVVYEYDENTKEMDNPFVESSAVDISKLQNQKKDIEMVLNNGMSNMKMSWTINGEVYPNLDPFEFKLNETYIIRFTNDSMHSIAHPMHIHGAHFVILSNNGIKTNDTIYKDTVSIPPNEYVDIAIKFDNEGEWMVHCHILDHEDDGMMTSINVTK